MKIDKKLLSLCLMFNLIMAVELTHAMVGILMLQEMDRSQNSWRPEEDIAADNAADNQDRECKESIRTTCCYYCPRQLSAPLIDISCCLPCCLASPIIVSCFLAASCSDRYCDTNCLGRRDRVVGQQSPAQQAAEQQAPGQDETELTIIEEARQRRMERDREYNKRISNSLRTLTQNLASEERIAEIVAIPTAQVMEDRYAAIPVSTMIFDANSLQK